MRSKIATWLFSYLTRAAALVAFIVFLSIAHGDAAVSRATVDALRKLLVTHNGHLERVLFSPDARIQEVYAHLIEIEARSICVAMYAFTDRILAQKLIEAHRRGIVVEVVVCRSGAQNKWSKVPILVAAGIPVYVYPAAYTNSIMHCKFALFMSNFDGKSIVGAGSYNWTISANTLNREFCIFSDDREKVAAFVKEFAELKKLSVLTHNAKKYNAALKAGYCRRLQGFV